MSTEGTPNRDKLAARELDNKQVEQLVADEKRLRAALDEANENARKWRETARENLAAYNAVLEALEKRRRGTNTRVVGDAGLQSSDVEQVAAPSSN